MEDDFEPIKIDTDEFDDFVCVYKRWVRVKSFQVILYPESCDLDEMIQNIKNIEDEEDILYDPVYLSHN